MTDLPEQPTVAVVDDDRPVLEAIGNLLESGDYQVWLFDSAEAMLASRCLAEIDCLVSDIDMPGMDGFALLRVAKARRPTLRVILITGQSNKLNQPPPPGLPAFELLKKPFSGSELLAMLGRPLAPP